MRDDVFKKYVAAKRMELEYRLMSVYYRDYTNNDKKPVFMFAQYTDILKDISICATGLCRSEDALDLMSADQIDRLTATLGGLFMKYLLKLQDKSLFDGFNDCLKNITGQELPDDIKDMFEEDDKDEE